MKSQETLFRLKQEGINLCFWMFGTRITPVIDVAAATGMLGDPAPVFDRLRGTAFAREVERIATCVLEHRFPLLTFAEVCTGPHIDWQRDLAQLSSCGRHVVASDSGHWIHLDHPELVTGAIREVVATARSLRCPSSNLTGAPR